MNSLTDPEPRSNCLNPGNLCGVLLQNDSDDFCYFLYDEYYLDNEEVFFNLEVVCQMQFEVSGSNIAQKKNNFIYLRPINIIFNWSIWQ